MSIQQSAGIRMPYELVPTALAGAFISPAPPDDFDPNTASPAALIKHGFLWRRPRPGDDPALHTAWERAFSRRWRAEDRLVPELEPQVGKTHQLKRATPAAGIDVNTNLWAGSVVPGNWTGVIGYWVIPAVTEPLQAQGTRGGWDSSSWVGIDGVFDSDDVLQAGVEQAIDVNGNAHYTAWYEWFAPIQSGSPPYVFQTNILNFPVSPGQTIYCSVLYLSDHSAGQVYFANESTGQHFSITLAPPPGATFNGSSAEWIMEAPDGGEPTTSLPIFTPLTFTSAICCGPGTAGNPSAGDTYNIVGFGTVLTSVTLGLDSVTIDYAGPLPAGAVCALSPGGAAVWQYDGSGAWWTQIGGPAGEIVGGGYGLVATSPVVGDLWRYLGTPQEWELIGGLGAGAEYVVTDDTVIGLPSGGQAVWQYDGTGTSWTQIGGPAGAIYGGGYGLVATNPSTGDLWRYLGTPQEWELIGSPGADFVVTDDTVIGLSPDRQAVWHYDGTGTSWSQIGSPAAEIVAVRPG
jgi:hypothetical protein